MHYHLEIIMPPSKDIKADIEKICIENPVGQLPILKPTNIVEPLPRRRESDRRDNR